MLRLFLAILLTPLILKAPYLLPPYDDYSFWWMRLELFFAYAGLLLFGIPMLFLFVRRGWIALWQVVSGATAAAALLVAGYFLMTNWEHFLLSGLRLSIYGLLSGALSGLVFWCIAFWGNPRFAGPNYSLKRTNQSLRD